MSGQAAFRPCRSCLGVIFTSMALALFVFPGFAQSSSNVRIVRLSFVEGTVNLHRPDVEQWAQAFINTPIQQGFELATDANSFAEVEFENGSTARLGQNSVLDFTELSLGADGNKTNRMSLSQGYATFTVLPERGDLYQITTPQGTFTADGKSTFRVDLGKNDLRLEVFKGHVQAESPYGGGAVAGNHVLEIRPGDSDAYNISRGIALDAWDQWVKQRDEQTTVARNSAGYQGANAYGSPYSSLYGWDDLYYYGSWNYLPGYGYGWSPYVASGWTPYSLGQWAYYPGFGYTWISGLPWGWLPFHYGNWIFLPGYGWCWMPGNFGNWSPGVVNWYQGSGWVGWYPYAGRFKTNGYVGCQAGMDCATAVSLSTFQNGGSITPNTIQTLDPAQGRRVASPNVTPTRFARLPGPVVSSPSVLSSSQNVQTTTAGRVSVPRGMRTGGATAVMRTFVAGAAPTMVHPKLPNGFEIRNPRGIVFNPATHQYENGSALPAARMSIERQTRGGRNTAVPLVMTPGSPTGNQQGGVRRPSAPAERPSVREGPSNRSNPNFQNNSTRNERQMNPRSSGSQPRMQSSPQPSGGFGSGTMMERSPGRSMQMPSRTGGGMGGGMQAPHGGAEGSRGPRR